MLEAKIDHLVQHAGGGLHSSPKVHKMVMKVVVTEFRTVEGRRSGRAAQRLHWGVLGGFSQDAYSLRQSGDCSIGLDIGEAVWPEIVVGKPRKKRF
jgi:hypothetical protein